jgi:hypothetical protein
VAQLVETLRYKPEGRGLDFGGVIEFFHRHNPCRILHNEELYDPHSPTDIIQEIESKKMRWAVNVASMGERRSVYRVLVGKSEGRRPLGKPRRRWQDNIKMNFQEAGWGHGLN